MRSRCSAAFPACRHQQAYKGQHMQDGQVAHKNAAAGAVAAIEAHWGEQHVLMEDTPAASNHTAGVSRLFCTCLVQFLFALGASSRNKSHAYRKKPCIQAPAVSKLHMRRVEHHGGQ